MCVGEFCFFPSLLMFHLLHSALFPSDWSMDYWKINVLVVVEAKKWQQRHNRNQGIADKHPEVDRQKMHESHHRQQQQRRRWKKNHSNWWISDGFHVFQSISLVPCVLPNNVVPYIRFQTHSITRSPITVQHKSNTHTHTFRQTDNSK